MDLHPGEQIVFQGRPIWRSILSFYITGFIGSVVIGVIVALIASTALGVIVFVVLFAIDVLVGFLRRVSTRYTITTQRLRIERGLLSKHVQQTRIERVQNVNTNQTFVSRILRVGTVDFDTAGTDDSDFTFTGDGNALYAAYHDDEWGAPVTDERGLFERVSLEAFQSGLSWLTILRKREAFRAAFANFEPDAVARFGDNDVDRLLGDAGIVRHRGKIEAAIANARA